MILDIEFTNLMNYIALGIAIVIFLILYMIAKSDFIPTEAQFNGNIKLEASKTKTKEIKNTK